jgi:acyl-CoA thioesterase YciA
MGNQPKPQIVPMSQIPHTPATPAGEGQGLAQPPAGAIPALKVIPMPRDCNANGDIFGGWVMAQVDLAGAVVAFAYAGGRMATVAVNEFVFKQPVRVGDILSFYGELVRTGRTSITVKIEVFAEHFRSQGRYTKVTQALLTYVAIDEQGRPRPLPPQEPEATLP